MKDKNTEVMQTLNAAHIPVYRRYPVVVSRANGKYVWDVRGRRFLDMFSGISVTNFGHSHPKITRAAVNQLSNYAHLSNYYYSQAQARLAQVLSKRTLGGGVFFSNSGAEANECAVKIARKWGQGRYEIITFKDSFHGRTLAMLAATGDEQFQRGFGPIPDGFVQAEFNNLGSVKQKINNHTVAVMVEIVQGEGGVNVATPNFLRGLEYLCHEKNLLLICDEIQTGLGRCGRFLAGDNFGIKPDIVTLGKALGGGLPLAATLVTPKLTGVMSYGDHGSTFGGNPVACAAGFAMVQMLDIPRFERIKHLGKVLEEGLNDIVKEHSDLVREARGLGLMWGLELNGPGAWLVDELREQSHILVNCTHERVLRFLPPFIINAKDILYLVSSIDKALANHAEKGAKI